MPIKPLRSDLKKYLSRHGLLKKFNKQAKIFSTNPYHPSLHNEILYPKKFRIYSFRIDQKYRAVYARDNFGMIEIVDINDHYQ